MIINIIGKPIPGIVATENWNCSCINCLKISGNLEASPNSVNWSFGVFIKSIKFVLKGVIIIKTADSGIKNFVQLGIANDLQNSKVVKIAIKEKTVNPKIFPGVSKK